MESWIHSPINEVKSASLGIFRQTGDGRMIKVKTEESSLSFYQLFLIEQDYSYPVARRGNYVIKRDGDDGSFEQVKIFLRNDTGSFIRIFPSGDRSIMDVFLLDHCIYKDVILPLNISQIFSSPLEKIMDMTSSRIDWSIFHDPEALNQNSVKYQTLYDIRNHLSELNDCEDGAMDRDGNYVFIEDLSGQEEDPGGFNCSGFAKWIVDGFVFPLTGELLDIVELKSKPLDIRGNSWTERSEDERDPFFGLDWTRALAVSLLGLQHGTGFSPEAADVRRADFFSYTEDVGWALGELEPLLYLLAKDEPNHFYLGSVNIPFGSVPVIRQHTHVVVLFPYFDVLGNFRVAVLERNQETTLSSLRSRYGNDFVHLVRVEARGEFILP